MPIRLAASLLAALLLAVGLGLGGYCLLLAWRGGPASAAERLVPPEIEPPAAPRRLPASDDFGPRRGEPTITLPLPRPQTLTVTAHGLPATLDLAVAGVAVFLADSGGEFTWTPFTHASGNRAAGLTVRPTVRGTGPFVITVAAERAFARHGYLARGSCDLTADSAPAAVLDASAAVVEFHLAPGQRRAGPFRLVRSDDPSWAAMPAGTTGLTVAGTEPARWLLGHGRYELLDPIGGQIVRRFEVPATTTVEISAVAAPRSDRP